MKDSDKDRITASTASPRASAWKHRSKMKAEGRSRLEADAQLADFAPIAHNPKDEHGRPQSYQYQCRPAIELVQCAG